MSDDALIAVRLTPRAARAGVTAVDEDGLVRVRVREPPVDGRANVALCRLVAEVVAVPRSRVEVVRGASAREKQLRVVGRDRESALAALRAAIPGG